MDIEVSISLHPILTSGKGANRLTQEIFKNCKQQRKCRNWDKEKSSRDLNFAAVWSVDGAVRPCSTVETFLCSIRIDVFSQATLQANVGKQRILHRSSSLVAQFNSSFLFGAHASVLTLSVYSQHIPCINLRTLKLGKFTCVSHMHRRTKRRHIWAI